MRRALCCLALALGLLAVPVQGGAEEDPRETVTLPPEVGAAFLAEMRAHMANLDDIVAALAAGEFASAARVADIHMTFGHHRWVRMVEEGASEAEIAAAKARFKQRRESGGMGQGGGMGMGPGLGRHMPESFRAMGASFHEAADSFAVTASAVTAPAAPGDYLAVLEALQAVTANCRACHEAFRIEVSE